MKIHKRNTYQSGADRMLLDNCWHNSTPLDGVRAGDTLRVINKDALGVVDAAIQTTSTSKVRRVDFGGCGPPQPAKSTAWISPGGRASSPPSRHPWRARAGPGHRRARRGMSRYFLPVKNSLMFSPLNLAPSTMVWPMPVNISLNPGPT